MWLLFFNQWVNVYTEGMITRKTTPVKCHIVGLPDISPLICLMDVCLLPIYNLLIKEDILPINYEIPEPE